MKITSRNFSNWWWSKQCGSSCKTQADIEQQPPICPPEDGLACIQPICHLRTMWQLADMNFSPVMQSGYIASLLTCCCTSIKGSVVISPCAFCVGVNFASGLILVYICPTGVHRRQDHPQCGWHCLPHRSKVRWCYWTGAHARLLQICLSISCEVECKFSLFSSWIHLLSLQFVS